MMILMMAAMMIDMGGTMTETVGEAGTRGGR